MTEPRNHLGRRTTISLQWGGWLCVFTSLLWGGQVPADGPPEATFRAGVKLVQVSVVAQDKKGKPVADLRRDEFQVLEDGTAQEIRLFLAETEKSDAGPSRPNAPHTFTNRLATPTGSRSGYAVILIDNLSTDFGDPFTEDGSAYARLQTLKMLRSIPLGEKIAIYALQRKIQVICEFTSDRDLLERQLAAWKGGADTPGTSGGVDPSPPGLRGDPAGEAARIDALQRASNSNAEMEMVADHLAGIPGRKNLIWLANRFTISPKALQKLSAASVAIYPVDPAGAKSPYERGRAMDALAAMTGGLAYHGRNDLDVAIREAIDDGRVSYTLGFYQSGEDRRPQVHQIAVNVSRAGVVLRNRTSFQTEAPRSTATTKADLVQALNRPVDATSIGLDASATRMQDRLNLEARLDVGSLDLMPNQGRWTGSIEVVGRFTAADGTLAGDRPAFSHRVDLKLRQATFDALLQSGLPYRNELKIPARAVEFKLLFANLATGKVGTLTIPLAEVEGAVTGK